VLYSSSILLFYRQIFCWNSDTVSRIVRTRDRHGIRKVAGADDGLNYGTSCLIFSNTDIYRSVVLRDFCCRRLCMACLISENGNCCADCGFIAGASDIFELLMQRRFVNYLLHSCSFFFLWHLLNYPRPTLSHNFMQLRVSGSALLHPG